MLLHRFALAAPTRLGQTGSMPFKPTPRHYDEQALYDYAVGALGRRMRTVAELKRLMRPRVRHQPEGELLIEVVVARLKEQRYLNDAGYAAAYSSFRKENEKFGIRRTTLVYTSPDGRGSPIKSAL